MSNETITSCPVCGNNQLEFHQEVPDYFGDQESFKLSLCKKCDTLSTNPRPDQTKITKYYKSNSYVSHGDKKGGLFTLLYQRIQLINFKYKLSLLNKYTLNKKHLDFGCGTGSFLNLLSKKGWQVNGVEPDIKARTIAIEQYNIASTFQSLEALPINETFSSISLFHVLEHVHSLEATLNQLISRLDNNGVIILALPNYKSYDAQCYQKFWAGYDVPRHLYHFSQKSIHQLAKNFGLNIVATHPMKFDSYYVSLLSEEYQSGKKNYLKAFLNGFISNKKAKKSNEYSSLIYVLSK
ncbi:hypothetical protein BFP97_14790 [Roseivirga sp. 4D4]|uniref:class I SAM-dependent methyltransferase n=1 Tax=Roseivirga sp. 4D4 TaxID=1889784 RepID=UPI000853A59F|nr:class I SAM-dependent methyltransferase [Roseivirga sp. 4D4]OEK02713.1 hypothetical protein BFP97_14790 [Roseivirga sp. 4D4]